MIRLPVLSLISNIITDGGGIDVPDKIHAFYCRKAWRDLSYTQKIIRGGKCERCGFTAVTADDWSLLIGHHKIELTEHNVDNADIALNPANVEIICQSCHNKEHRRFGYAKRVFLVYGSPLSGKSTAVREMMRHGDIVLDIDRLWSAITMQPEFVKPDSCKLNVFKLRGEVLSQIKMRYGNWSDAYVIGGYPDKYERERVAATLGAAVIYCESTIDECLQRRRDSGRPEEWDEFVKKWWEDYLRTS